MYTKKKSQITIGVNSLKKGLFLMLTLCITVLCNGQNNIGQIDDRSTTDNYRSIDGWGEYPVTAGSSTDNHDPRIERKGLTKIKPGDKRTFQATYKILNAQNTTFAQILNQDQNSPDKHKPVVFIIAEPSGNNWKLRDQQFSLGTVPKNSEFVLRIDTYYNSTKTKAFSDIYINGVKKETKQHARVGQDAQMRYGNYHHGSGKAIIRVKNVTWQTTPSGGGTNSAPSVSFQTPSGNLTVNQGYNLTTRVNANDSDGSISNVKLYINNDFVRQEGVAPYDWGHANSPNPNELNNLSPGTYTIKAVATDNDGATGQDTFKLTVVGNTPNNNAPTVSFQSPGGNLTVNQGYNLKTLVNASDSDGSISNVKLYINNVLVRQEILAPYEWGHATSPNPNELNNLSSGTYTIKATATDNDGAQASDSFILTVNSTSNNTSCSFGAPRSNSLPGYDGVTFYNVYVLGSGGPSQSNIEKFKIKWVPGANDPYVFSINTNNGQPASYIDLRSVSNAKFNGSQPDVSISDSGFPGLDGDYWVTNHNGNFVMVAKNGNYTIYCSNSGSAPGCNSSRTAATKQLTSKAQELISIYPNPAKNTLSILLADVPFKTTEVVFYNSVGSIVKTEVLTQKQNQLDISAFASGIYFAEVINNDRRTIIKVIKQ